MHGASEIPLALHFLVEAFSGTVMTALASPILPNSPKVDQCLVDFCICGNQQHYKLETQCDI